MKTTFTRILAIITLAIVSTLGAHAQMHWAATANVNLSGLDMKQSNIVKTSQTVGYGAGVMGEVIFPGIGIGLDLGLMYNQTGGKINLGSKPIWADNYGNEQLYLHNIYLPLHLRMKYTRLGGIEEYIAPFVFAGPEFTIQIAHNKCSAIDFSGGDFGIGFGGGAEIKKKFQVSVSYHMGLTYAMKTKLLDDFSGKCRYLSVRFAYFFK